MSVQVKDLKDQIGTDGPRSILLCRVCGGEYSANAGDYWNTKPQHILKCCGEPMDHVIKKTIYEKV